MSDTPSMSRQSSRSHSSLIRSLKHTRSDRELEEGETISPSPSPHPSERRKERRDRSRSRHKSSRHRSESRHSDSRRSDSRRRSESRRSDSRRSDSRRRSESRRSDSRRRNYRHYRSRSRSPRKSRRRSRSSDRSRRRPSPRSEYRKKRHDDNSEEDRKEDEKRSSRKHRSTSRERRKEESKSDNKSGKDGLSAASDKAYKLEQQKLYTIMFGKLARANKKRGDSQKDAIFGMIDHFHSLCDYMLNFYYMDASAGSSKLSIKEAFGAWKTLFPFADNLLSKLQSHKLYSLYGLCARLISLVRYYVFDRMVSMSQNTVSNLTADLQPEEGQKNYDLAVELYKEYEKAEQWFHKSEEHFSYTMFMTEFPMTYQSVYIKGDLTAGISLGGEAGTEAEHMFPFGPYAPLHHAAIVSKCILHEYITKEKLDYTPIQKPEEYMDQK